MVPLGTFSLALLISFPVFADVISDGKNCTCGFFDTETAQLYTDSIIVYFNETDIIPNDFVIEDFVHSYEKDWNAVYREGADRANVRINGSDFLELAVQPSSEDHVVKGGGIRTLRRDIQHGSFRTLIKSPRQTFKGSAMSMMLRYNESEVTELSVMNPNDESDAWVGTFVNNEFTTRDLGVNYTQLSERPVANRNYTTLAGGSFKGQVNAWDYIEYRVDWTKHYINFYVGGNLTRQVLQKDKSGMPSVPAALYLKHWSNGNRFSMKGPPRLESTANVGWVRMFFNSSSTSEEARRAFASNCSPNEACSMNDVTLRGSSSYLEDATRAWKQNLENDTKRMPALWISVGCLALSTFLVVHTLIRRFKQPQLTGHGHARPLPPASPSGSTINHNSLDKQGTSANAEEKTSADSSPTLSGNSPSVCRTPTFNSADDLAIESLPPSHSYSEFGGSTPDGPSRAGSIGFDSRGTTPRAHSLFAGPTANDTREHLYSPAASQFKFPHPPGHDSNLTLRMEYNNFDIEDKVQMEMDTKSALPAPRMTPQPKPQRQRIDHLAGLTALCSLFVTIMHFGLTFVPAIVMPGAPQHAPSEYWAQKIIAPIILNQMWLGVFFTTSVRFLVAPYLRKGRVEDIAKAAVRRTPRLVAPVAVIAMLEYFLIDIGATSYLRYIPSLTWSTWPYVTRFENVGQYISELLELVYLIPNAVPQITLHYCTGVLWTIAVQLQGTWLVLLGAIIVCEMKTASKRMAFYAFCIVNHWYANSWGTYLWLGLLLTDLDVTYEWKDYLAKRPLAYYPIITACWLCVAAGFGVNIIPNWADFNFATIERNIHPDVITGEPFMNTDRAGYPEYYTPRLNGLLFAGGMQAIVELSTAVQWLLSTPPLLILFPHIFTIYLLHGIIFWTWGSWLLVFLATRHIHYSINVAIVGVTSYALLFLCLPIITPLLEALGKDLTALIWTTAKEKSPPRRSTLFPFPGDLLTGRAVNKSESGVADIEAGASIRSSSSMANSYEDVMEKSKTCEEVREFAPRDIRDRHAK